MKLIFTLIFLIFTPSFLGAFVLLRELPLKGSCEALIFTSAADFAKYSSSWASHSSRENLYPEWAAQRANEVAQKFNSGKDIDKILMALAESRKDLQAKMDKKKHLIKQFLGLYKNDFGIRRENNNDGGYYITGIGYKSENKKIPADVKEVINLAIKKISNQKALSIFLNYLTFKANSYVTKDGKSYASTNILVDGDAILALNPTIEISELIMKDVISRLAFIQTTGRLSSQIKLEYFLTAMYGFYNAKPFLRGTSAIGRSFFSGIYMATFKQKLPELPNSVDLLAMVCSSPEEFIQKVSPYFIKTQSVISPSRSTGKKMRQ